MWSGRVPVILILGFGLIFQGCTSSPSSGPSGVRTMPERPIAQSRPISQIIIKFRDPKFDPSRTEFVQALSERANVRMDYVRPMSGDAHVFRLQDALDAAAIDEVVRRLSQRPDVEYAEPDSPMQHQ